MEKIFLIGSKMQLIFRIRTVEKLIWHIFKIVNNILTVKLNVTFLCIHSFKER